MMGSGTPEDILNRARGNGTGLIEAVRAADVETKPVTWLWNNRIPEGKLTIFDGDPDLGKSVVTLDIAARVSTGRPFADGAPVKKPSNVLICNVEDSADDTIVPRLKAHGADLDRVFLFSSAPDDKGGQRLLELPQDIGLLENLILQYDAKLLIIDPVLTMLGGDANKDQDARKALAPVRDMAEKTGVAVVAVRHLNKSIGLKAIQRGGGNMGLIGVARAGSFFAEHPDDHTLRIMAVHKSNLTQKPPSLSYRIVTSAVHDTARVEWMGTTEYDANALAADAKSPGEKSELDAAKEFLLEELRDAPMWSKQIFKDAHDAGVAQKTLYRAKGVLGVKSEKQGTGSWVWLLPDKDGQKMATNKDGHVGHVGHVQRNNNGHPEYSSYLSEGGQDGQGGQPAEEDGHLHPNGHLSADEGNERVQRLIDEGMAPDAAVAQVMGEEL